MYVGMYGFILHFFMYKISEKSKIESFTYDPVVNYHQGVSMCYGNCQ